MTTQVNRRIGGLAPIALFVLAVLLAATSIYILFVPIDASNFEATTGVSWDVFSSSSPDVADYLRREARLLAVGWISLSLLTAALAWGPLRRGERWVRRVLWLFPITLWAAAVVFLLDGDAALGGIYLVVGGIAAIALAASTTGAKGPGSKS